MYIRTLILTLCILLTPIGAGAASSGPLETQLGKLTALVGYVERALGHIPSESLSADAMRGIIIDGTAWLQSAQEANGHFAYEYAPYDGLYSSDDNIVRQAGALYQLGEVVRRDTDDALELVGTIESAIAYFEGLSKEDTHNDEPFRCIVANERSTQCKLGATALALIGMLSYVEAYPDKAEEYDALIEDYAAYIRASYNDGAGFRYIHRVGADEQNDRESSFSNGEALLALVRYYQYAPSADIENMAKAAYAYLEETEFDTALYLWMMAALKDMQELWPDPAYAAYAKEYTDWRIIGVATRKGTRHNYCAYAEGVASAYSVLADTATPAERAALRSEIDFWNNKNALLQIDASDRFRYVPEEDGLVLLRIDDMEQAHGGFLTGQDELAQRIDFTQHCINTYLQTLVDIDGEPLSARAGM